MMKIGIEEEEKNNCSYEEFLCQKK